VNDATLELLEEENTVERLRRLVLEAADEIKRLETEIKRLREQVQRLIAETQHD
jgi:HAMP domain-containing protein